ncbi:hypothetical protein ASPVEDRAFT_77126 [Aspergillus versicolor CBS 583.65]|uniref:Alginate lyase domain-containing protein n=1 Tax=Aspergillus versicolor CBS 583.65 TaxID=1036611 RepID=A0A1L9Q3X5_ASPVE|nr:uncharacterized protein ASPVEDRAFT_77126 [Aspergillus versicolor CBS 583.65]OJJ08470.1 hypothetical protein ASPVEDRAFT_77126 [Aspergillus versicolor CBS 583.65]
MKPILILGALSTALGWVHPGIGNTKDDLDRLIHTANSGLEPWDSALTAFAADVHSTTDYKMLGPCPIVTRTKENSTSVCVNEFAEDAVASLQQTLMWIITGDQIYPDNSLALLNAWGHTLTKVNGSDAQLAAALSGSNFINAAEIVRYSTNLWTAEDIAAFSDMVSTAMYPPAAQYIPSAEQSIPFIANWGTSGAKFMLAASVFLENQTAYDTAKHLMLHSQCANFTGSISPTGQTTETGRDQAHGQLGIGNWIEAFYTLHNQNDSIPWFTMENNRLFNAMEYEARVMLNQTDGLPYDPAFNSVTCNSSITPVDWPVISKKAIWPVRPTWELGYAIARHIFGIELPKTRELIFAVAPDGPNPPKAIADGSAFQTLRFRRLADAQPLNKTHGRTPSGLDSGYRS